MRFPPRRALRVLLGAALLFGGACTKSDESAPSAAPAFIDARGVVDPRRVAFNPAVPNRLLVAERSGTVSVWDVTKPQQPTKTMEVAAGADDGQFLPDGSAVVTGGPDGSVRVWGLDGKERWKSPPHAGPIRAIAVGPDRIASAGEDGAIMLWTFDGKSVGTLTGTEGMVLSVAFSPRGDWIASEGSDTRLRLWHRQDDGTYVAGPVFREPSSRYQQMLPNLVRWDVQWGWDRSVAFTTGPLLAATDFTGAAQLWSLDGSAQGPVLKGQDGHHVRQVAVSADGNLIATGSLGGGVNLWNLDGSPQGEPLTAHTDAVSSLAFDPRGGRLASASNDGSVLLWSVADGRVVGSLPRGR